jgi:hypothetical protein
MFFANGILRSTFITGIVWFEIIREKRREITGSQPEGGKTVCLKIP